eukprot:Phypoly_transcript_15569.p1 GENE.Phypoly_transcript_15569~~Phypoly_transcript_15569.p1  ORF type:complete len:296 (+),score=21.50 Phypoly_transcript_15569:83-889(+)
MGWATCYKMGNWENQIEYFSQFPEFEVCIFDNRGSGLSSSPPGKYSMQMLAQDALKVAYHLGWEKFHLMGASMGGMISQRIAVIAPQRIRSLTLLCTRFDSGWWHSLPSWTALGIIVKQHFEAYVWKDETSHVRNLLNLLFSSKYLADTHPTGTTNRDYLLKKMSERRKIIPPMNVKGSLSQLAAIQSHQITEKDVDIFLESKFTTLVITGDNDLMVPHKHSLHIKSTLRHKAELVVIEGAGHGVLEESKHFINEKVKDFILNSINTQ